MVEFYQAIGKKYYNLKLVASGGCGEGDRHHYYRKQRSIETRNKISATKKGNSPAPNKGKPCSQETRRKVSQSLTGKKQSQETIQKRLGKTIGLKRTELQKQHLREAWIKRKPNFIGRKHTEEHKMKISNSLKGRPSSKKGKKYTKY